MVVSGRSFDFTDVEKVIGPLFNTVPFYVWFGNDDTWASVVRRCQDYNSAVLPYQHTPLRDVMKWTRISADQPLFDTLFVFQKVEPGSEPQGKKLWRSRESSIPADYPLALEVEQQSNSQLKLTLVAQGQIADREAASALVEEFQQALAALMEDSDALVNKTVGHISETKSNIPESKTNGHADGHVNGVHDFKWTSEAERIRDEVAVLASVDPSEVDEHVSILELGLDSIDAIKLSSRLGKLGTRIPVSQIMRSLTIGRMIEHIAPEQAPKEQSDPGENLCKESQKLKDHLMNGMELDSIEILLPATPLQESMVAEMFNSGFTRYYNQDVLKLQRSTNKKTLRTAWRR
ncbi:hypothetical protein LTS18_013668, partial [Coniosporium uncinatum]